ncbi:HNH endonuclease [Pseudanabaena phage Pan5]|nr:HNH endonuclease [Pseudanabaena phage Pan5]
MALTYKEKLLDPRWQKKRLEIMNRDGFKCVYCGEEKETLNVHHCVYAEGTDPWEYYDRFLVTLCKNCHEKEHSKESESAITAIEIGVRVSLTFNERLILADEFRKGGNGFIDSLKALINTYGKEND